MRNLLVGLMAFLGFCTAVHASSVSHTDRPHQIRNAKAIFRGTVLENVCFRNPVDGGIYTRTTFQVDEALKGKFGATVSLVHRGGRLANAGEFNDFAPKFVVGDEQVVFIDRRQDGTLFSFDGDGSAIHLHRQQKAKNRANAAGPFSADENDLIQQILTAVPTLADKGIDVTTQDSLVTNSAPGSGTTFKPASVGLLTEGSGVSSRFTAGDRGEKIPYIVDAQAMPAGVTLPQALTAISNAFNAWSAVTSARFVYEGTNNFGMAAGNFSTNDHKIRIQLHDLYHYISGSEVLGQGGNQISWPDEFANGGMGARIGTNEFYLNDCGFVVLAHTQADLQNLSTLEEVLTHEIGHVLSMDHSSTNFSETDTNLYQSIMYFEAHEDGRGARLDKYDTNTIQQVYPASNTPPYGYDRLMTVVHSPYTLPNILGINSVELRGYDLQSSNLSLFITNQTSLNGTFSLSAQVIKYAPAHWFGSDQVIDPADGYWDVAYARYSDGTNASPFIQAAICSMLSDTYPSSGSDGIPDSWMTTYFGNANPAVGQKHTATADFDGDGVNNLTEFLCGTDPTSNSSALKLTSVSMTNLQWIAQPYDVYELQASQDLKTWTRAINPIIAVSNVVTATNFATIGSAHQFFRVQRVP